MAADRFLEALRARGWFGPLARLPMLAFHVGLRPVVGRAFMILTTRGRRSGLPRRTMLLFQRLDGKVYAVAAYGHRSQWYRNLQADPHVTIETAAGPEQRAARVLTDRDEIIDVARRLARRPVMRAYLSSLGVGSDPDAIEQEVRRILLVAFE